MVVNQQTLTLSTANSIKTALLILTGVGDTAADTVGDVAGVAVVHLAALAALDAELLYTTAQVMLGAEHTMALTDRTEQVSVVHAATTTTALML